MLKQRNNQDCEYTLAKKQQASKKSQDLGPPMNVQGLIDEFTSDASWNFDLDPEGILLPTGDIENVLDFGRFSWPVSAPNDDCNFEIDVPFTADGVGTANDENTVSTIENSCPSHLNLFSQTTILNEPSRDDKMLDLNDKVRVFTWGKMIILADFCTDMNSKVTTKGFLGKYSCSRPAASED